MARKRTTTKSDDAGRSEPTAHEADPDFTPTVGRTEAAQAEWEAEAAEAVEREQQRLAAEAVAGGAGPGETGDAG